jgi:hypothetical protein
MKSLPDMVFVVDVKREETAVHEANLTGMPVIALVDTNCDPGGVDYVIPSNDDAIRAIKLLTAKVADAVLEGINLRKDKDEEVPDDVAQRDDQAAAELTDEELLGAATLAKLQSGDFGVQEEAAAAEAGEAKAEEPETDAKEAVAEETEAGEAKAEEDEAGEAMAEEAETGEEATDDAEAAEVEAEEEEVAEPEEAEAEEEEAAEPEDAETSEEEIAPEGASEEEPDEPESEKDGE